MQQNRVQSVSGSSRRARVLVLLVALVVGLGSVQAFGAGEAGAAEPVPQMYQGPPFADAGPAPTEDKPQSKLWFNDGAWWALMRTSGNGADGNPDVTIHRLLPDHTWQNTGTVVDGRAASTGDALWQGGTLFVASRVTSGTIQAARLSYDAGTQTYAMDAGFPKSVATGSVESVTITRDSLGRLWVTYTDDDQVWVAHSTTDDTTWTAPFPVPVSDNDISSDDISAIVAFSGRIGVMWSDQGSQVMRFAVHQDSSPDASGWTMETALSGTRSADDHVNLKALVEDDQGRVYAAIKTSRGDSSSDSSSDPSIRVLSRSSSGTWTATTAATVGENLTRPQLALDATNRRLYVVMTTESGGDVYYRHAPLGASLSFTPRATLLTWPGASLNNATTAKAPVTAASGLVVLASDDDETDRYYHAELALNGAAADTTAPSTPSGLTATANSSGQVTVSWTASTDDVGVTSYRVTRNGTVVGPTVTGATSFEDTMVAPSSTYSYTVSAVDGAGNRSAESVAVSVTTPAAPVGVPASSFTSSVAGGESPVEVAFTDTSTGSPTSWAWDFGDGSTSTEQHPVHTFVAAGSFVVTLTASNGAGAGAPASQTVTVTEPAGPPPVGGEVVAGASAQAVSTAAVTSVTIGKPAGVATGDVLIAQFTANDAPSVTSVPAGWSAVVEPLAIRSLATVFVYYRVVADAAAEPASWTWQLSSAQKWNAVVTAFGGVDAGNPFDSDAGIRVNSYRSKALNVPGVTTLTPGAMLVGGAGADSGSVAITEAAGWTEAAEGSGAQVSQLAYQPRPQAGDTGTAAMTLSTSQYAGGWQRALRPAAPGEEPPPVTGEVPASSFTSSVAGGESPVEVAFTDTSTGSPTSWAWDFGDGSTSTEQNPVHTFVAAGSFVVTLTASNGAGAGAPASQTVTVTEPAAPVGVPASSFTSSVAGGESPVEVAFTDTSTGSPTSWAWDFGDGSTSTEQHPVHTFVAAGSFVVTLTASNGAGAGAPASQTVTVTEPAGPPPVGGEVVAGASAQAVSTAAVTSVTIGKPAGVATGDVLIAQFTANDAPSVTSVPAGWSAVVEPLAIRSLATVFVYYRVVADAAAEPASWTWQLSSAQKWNAVVTAFGGVDAGNPFDSDAGIRVNSYRSKALNVPGVTTLTPGAMLVGGAGADSGSVAITEAAGWTEAAEGSGAQVSQLAYQPRPQAGDTGTAAMTLSTSQYAGGWQRALRPALRSVV